MNFLLQLSLGFVQLLVSCYRALSPLLGTQSCCRYKISCSEYFLQAVQHESFLIACWKSLKRFLSCNPFTN